jgi:hypothetical protein
MFSFYQTDFDGYIRADGCLLFSIIAWACKLTNGVISEKGVYSLIDELHRRRAIGAERDISAEGVFVYNHETCFNRTFDYLQSDICVRYNHRLYMPWEEARGKKSWLSSPGWERTGNVIIWQIKTANGNGHFRTPFYDPYKPSPEMADLKSLRFYQTY